MSEGKGGALLAGLAGAAALVLAGTRIARRGGQRPVECGLRCYCGAVRGRLRAIPEDAQLVVCYCRSCRAYARWVAGLAKESEARCVVRSDSGSSFLQICKSDVLVDQGIELLQLAVRDAHTTTCRFFARCCNTPIFHTSESLGVINVSANILDDNVSKFGQPRVLFVEESEKPTQPSQPNEASLAESVWNTLRYAPYASQGPKLNYRQRREVWTGM